MLEQTNHNRPSNTEANASQKARSSSSQVWQVMRDYVLPILITAGAVGTTLYLGGFFRAWAAVLAEQLGLSANDRNELTRIFETLIPAESESELEAAGVINGTDVPVYLGSPYGDCNDMGAMSFYDDYSDMVAMQFPGNVTPSAGVWACVPSVGGANFTSSTALFGTDENGTQVLVTQFGASSLQMLFVDPDTIIGPLTALGTETGWIVATAEERNGSYYSSSAGVMVAERLTELRDMNASMYQARASEDGDMYQVVLNTDLFQEALERGYELNTTAHLVHHGARVPVAAIKGPNVTWQIQASSTGVIYPKLRVIGADGNSIEVPLEWSKVAPVFELTNPYLQTMQENPVLFKALYGTVAMAVMALPILGGRLPAHAKGIRKRLSFLSQSNGPSTSALAVAYFLEAVTFGVGVGLSVMRHKDFPKTNLPDDTIIKYGPGLKATLGAFRTNYQSGSFFDTALTFGMVLSGILFVVDLIVVMVMFSEEAQKHKPGPDVYSVLNDVLRCTVVTIGAVQCFMGNPAGGFMLAMSMLETYNHLYLGVLTRADGDDLPSCSMPCRKMRYPSGKDLEEGLLTPAAGRATTLPPATTPVEAPASAVNSTPGGDQPEQQNGVGGGATNDDAEFREPGTDNGKPAVEELPTGQQNTMRRLRPEQLAQHGKLGQQHGKGSNLSGLAQRFIGNPERRNSDPGAMVEIPLDSDEDTEVVNRQPGAWERARTFIGNMFGT